MIESPAITLLSTPCSAKPIPTPATPMPAMSGDQRKKIVAQLKKSAENAKVACRNIRRDGNKHFDDAEKAKTMTEDEREFLLTGRRTAATTTVSA